MVPNMCASPSRQNLQSLTYAAAALAHGSPAARTFPLRTIGMGRGLHRTHLVTLEPVREGAPGWLEDSQFNQWTGDATSS